MSKIAGILQEIIPDGKNHKQYISTIFLVEKEYTALQTKLEFFLEHLQVINAVSLFTVKTFPESHFMVRSGIVALLSTSNYGTNAIIHVQRVRNLSVEVLKLQQL